MTARVRKRTLRSRKYRARGWSWADIAKKMKVPKAALTNSDFRLRAEEAEAREDEARALALVLDPPPAKSEPLMCEFQVRRNCEWEPKCRGSAMPCLCEARKVTQ